MKTKLFLIVFLFCFLGADRIPENKISTKVKNLEVGQSGWIPYPYVLVSKERFAYVYSDDEVLSNQGKDKLFTRVKITRLRFNQLRLDISTLKEEDKFYISDLNLKNDKNYYLVTEIVE